MPILEKAVGYIVQCVLCEHIWITKAGQGIPKSCTNCGSSRWNEYMRYRRRRRDAKRAQAPQVL